MVFLQILRWNVLTYVYTYETTINTSISFQKFPKTPLFSLSFSSPHPRLPSSPALICFLSLYISFYCLEFTSMESCKMYSFCLASITQQNYFEIHPHFHVSMHLFHSFVWLSSIPLCTTVYICMYVIDMVCFYLWMLLPKWICKRTVFNWLKEN